MRQVAGLGILLVVASCVASCGSPQKPGGGGGGGTTEPPVGGGPVTFAAGSPVTPENICTRIFSLKSTDCEVASGYELTEPECVDAFRRSLEERGAEAKQANEALGRCLLDNDSCDAVGTCISSLSQAESGFRECGAVGSAPVGLPPAEWEKRRGASSRRYSDVPTTKEEPIEVCQIRSQMEWLLSQTCDDGSQPFRGFDHAHAARVGNVGPGGSCGSIVDLYEVPCPEGTYKIFIDAYVCPKD